MTRQGSIPDFLAQREVRRVTHFTNSRNLPKIIAAGEISSTAKLRARDASFAETDPERYDGWTSHVCCNIEYPNMYYFDKASTRRNNVNFSDWVVFMIDPRVLDGDGVLFAPGNAAKNSGRDVKDGMTGLAAQYAGTVYGRSRSVRHFPASPTDVQAEVLIPDSISLSVVRGIVVADTASLNREIARLKQIGVDPGKFAWHVSGDMFRKYAVVNAVRASTPIVIHGPYSEMVKKESDRHGIDT